jgi:hypothetical protein
VAKIPSELVEFVESGVSILVGTASADLRPEATRGAGAKVAPDREHVSIWLAESWGARALADVREAGVIAVGFSRLLDNTSIQLKGDGAVALDASPEDRAFLERYRASYVEQLYLAGLPRSLTSRMHLWPAKVVRFRVRDIFVQTPGPGAGARLEAGR